jgi:hypothetical protein
MRRLLLVVFFALIVISGVFAYRSRIGILDWIEAETKPALPQAERYQLATASTTENVNVEPTKEVKKKEDVLPDEKHLLVPFTTQAPDANWEMPYQEACEEASLIMVAGYYHGDEGVYDPKDADQEILNLIAFEENKFGLGADMTAKEATEVISSYDDSLKADVEVVLSAEQIKRYIAQGIPIIVPANGKTLGNPNFRNGGPVYHMLVITGYADGTFITNDPGTRKGYDYVYQEDVLMHAIHDWNGGDVPNGERVMIVIRPKSL